MIAVSFASLLFVFLNIYISFMKIQSQFSQNSFLQHSIEVVYTNGIKIKLIGNQDHWCSANLQQYCATYCHKFCFNNDIMARALLYMYVLTHKNAGFLYYIPRSMYNLNRKFQLPNLDLHDQILFKSRWSCSYYLVFIIKKLVGISSVQGRQYCH